MSWNSVKLGELYTVHNGLSKGSKFFGSGYPFLTFSTVFNNYFIPPELDSFVQSSEAERQNYSIKRGDVFVTRTSETSDELGMSCVALKDYPNATYNGFTKRMRPFTDRVLPEFIGYYMRMPSFRGEFLAFSTMTTRASLKNEDLLGLQIRLPEKETQKRIADILSAYDNLVENNQKQIKLLEEAAQRLYKEWFVDLRFPGYEDTPIVDGVPEGWTLGELGDIAIDSGKKEKKEHRGQYQYYLPIDCLPKRSLAYTDKNDITLAESSLVAFVPNDILFGAMRPYFHKVVVARDKGLTRTTCFVINSKMPAYWAYLLLLLFSKDTVDYATQISVGTTMPYVRWKDFIHMPTLIPPEEKCDAFQAIVLPMIERISCLAVSSERLIQARDHLLPKLMSGEIEV